MKKLKYILGSILLVGAVTLHSCKKNNDVLIQDVTFTDLVKNYDVTFTNTTAGATSYKWDFGDGATSTQQSPKHTYSTKGKFVATLYATLTGGQVISGSTIINVSKSSPIVLTDNSLSDWDTISKAVTPTSALGKIVKTAKFDYDSQNIYIYMEIQTTVAAGNIFDFYLDTDFNSTTGLLTGEIPTGGYDYLLEGPLLSAANGLVQYQHIGGQTAFSFNPLTIADYYTVGTVQQVGNTVKFEMALSRSKIGGLSGKTLRFGIIVSDANYSELGYMPGQNQNAIVLDISQ